MFRNPESLVKSNFDQGESKFETAICPKYEAFDEVQESRITPVVNSSPEAESAVDREPESQQSNEKNQSASSSSSENTINMNSEEVTSIVPILSDLNETAVEMINQDMVEEAFDSLLKAEYIISSLLPGGDEQVFDKQNIMAKMEDTFVCTIYYNLAWVCQKLSRLEDWVKFLDKSIQFLNNYCERKGEFLHSETVHKLTPKPGQKKIPKAEEYNDLLMKYRYLTKFNLQYCAVLSQLSQ